jgi:hypothetical protein
MLIFRLQRFPACCCIQVTAFSSLLLQARTTLPRSYLKNTSNAQLRCCGPPQNAHILPCMLRFFVGPRPRVGGITHQIILIKVCLLSLNVICIFEIASRVLLGIFGFFPAKKKPGKCRGFYGIIFCLTIIRSSTTNTRPSIGNGDGNDGYGCKRWTGSASFYTSSKS